MKKKKWILAICLVLGIIALLMAATALASTMGYGVSVGKLYFTEASVFLIDGTSSMIVSDQSRKSDLFDGYANGDEIILVHDGVEEVFPARTGGYMAFRISKGDGTYKPADNLLGIVIQEEGDIILPQGFASPPECTLLMPDYETQLTLAGYNWNYRLEDDRWVATIADQASRPLSKDYLIPVYIEKESAETVYAPVPGTDAYAPTNSLGYLLNLSWETAPSSVTYTCWPDTVWEKSRTVEQQVISLRDHAFYAWQGGYIYEITATWNDTGVGYYGTANYYVYITDEDTHLHMTALTPQTVADPVTGYCGNTWTTLYLDGKEYGFMYGHSVTLTDLLVNLDYDPGKVCRCMAQYRADTEFGTNYQINLEYGFVRCDLGQADLTQDQIQTIADIVNWAETTNCQYPIDD